MNLNGLKWKKELPNDKRGTRELSKQKLINGIKLLNKCKDCQIKFNPKKSMIDELFCDLCMLIRENMDKFSGQKCNRGHPTVFSYNPYPERTMVWCEKCRVYQVIDRKNLMLLSQEMN